MNDLVWSEQLFYAVAYMNDLVRSERERNIRPDPESDAFMKFLFYFGPFHCRDCNWGVHTCVLYAVLKHGTMFTDDAEDMYGKSMRCRFPYDQRGRLILEVMLIKTYH
ncbi:hypothetical protein DVH24_034644 [Malus domestica]|uniref:Uncharacterized protein n=1 Tax=Malus domestica TaxID=3750 RepID=A0A498J060_MALDO|nr:hypothetical protein DVH24_034644 [Malus domestica]